MDEGFSMKKREPSFIPKHGDLYHTIHHTGLGSHITRWTGSEENHKHLKKGNIFKTQKEAGDHLELITPGSTAHTKAMRDSVK